MKTILLIFIISLSLKADYLVKYETVNSTTLIPATFAFCIKDYYFTPLNLVYELSTGSNSINIRTISNLSFHDNYYKDVNGTCRPKTSNYNNLGLTENQFNFLSALTGLLTSILLVFVIFLKV
jgi:hypothetical protein